MKLKLEDFYNELLNGRGFLHYTMCTYLHSSYAEWRYGYYHVAVDSSKTFYRLWPNTDARIEEALRLFLRDMILPEYREDLEMLLAEKEVTNL